MKNVLFEQKKTQLETGLSGILWKYKAEIKNTVDILVA